MQRVVPKSIHYRVRSGMNSTFDICLHLLKNASRQSIQVLFDLSRFFSRDSTHIKRLKRTTL